MGSFRLSAERQKAPIRGPAAVVFLAGPAAASITGQTIDIDGGLTAA
jgi:NAD(P)-dependent dehydrogenase (short-subunit alcohol dehydrogenase family)